jgi:hypothetical protein
MNLEFLLTNLTTNTTGFICCFCEGEMDEHQVFCCETYKGKMTVEEFNEYYG